MYFEDDLVSVLIPLEESKNAKTFLAKTGIAFLFYFFFGTVVNIILILFMRMAKEWYRILMLNNLKWIIIILSIIIKLSFTILNKYMRKFQKFLFIIDCLLYFCTTLGLYFYFKENWSKYFLNYGHYIIIIVFTFFFNQVIFIVSTFIKFKKKYYPYKTGIVLMSLSTIFTFLLISRLFMDISIGILNYIIMFMLFSIWNVYFCLNSSYVLKYRKAKYYEHEYILCFFHYWGDWFYTFWIDVLRGTSVYRKFKRK